MADKYKLLKKIENNPNNTNFKDFQRVIKMFGFEKKRQTGSHVMYDRKDIDKFLNIQKRGNKAKSEQIKTFLSIVKKYKL